MGPKCGQEIGKFDNIRENARQYEAEIKVMLETSKAKANNDIRATRTAYFCPCPDINQTPGDNGTLLRGS